MQRISGPMGESHKEDIVGLYKDISRNAPSPMPQEVIEMRASTLAHDLGSLHVLLAVWNQRSAARGKVHAALLIDARDRFRQTQLLVDEDSFATELPESLLRMAATSELALSFKRFGFLLTDKDTQVLQRLEVIARDKLKQHTNYVPLPLDPNYPGFGSANLAYFSAPFNAFYGAPNSRRPQHPDLDFLLSPGITHRVSEFE
ncbi:MAG: hypothetical protein NTX63_04350 [Candidatus Peregrinibacteria bacterium]|nr:hypothetical protein [Candidatus Peregrinibacteria bacterium]